MTTSYCNGRRKSALSLNGRVVRRSALLDRGQQIRRGAVLLRREEMVLFRRGRNVIAVYCDAHNRGPKYFDIGLVEVPN